MVVFHKNRESLIGIKAKNKLQIYHSKDSLASVENILSDYKTRQAVSYLKAGSLSNFLQVYDKRILVVDSLGIYEIPELKPDVILLSSSPQINLNRLIKIHQP